MPARKKSLPIGKRLSKMRREKKLTLKNFAKETVMSTDRISQI